MQRFLTPAPIIGSMLRGFGASFLPCSSAEPSTAGAQQGFLPTVGEVSRRWATKKVGGSSRNGRTSNPQHRGIKESENTQVKAGYVLARQLGFKWHPGFGVGVGRDATLFAQYDGTVRFVHWNVRVQRAGRWETHRRVYMCVEPTPEEAARLVRAAPPGSGAPSSSAAPSDVIPPFSKERLLQLTLRRTKLPGSPADLVPGGAERPEVLEQVLSKMGGAAAAPRPLRVQVQNEQAH